MQTLSSNDKSKFLKLQLIRSTLAAVLSIFIVLGGDLGTEMLWLVLASVLGTLLAGKFLQQATSFPRTLLRHIAFFTALFFALWCANFFVTNTSNTSPTKDFYFYRLSEHFFLIMLFYSCSFLSTWFYWTKKSALTWETVIGAVCFLWFLSGHRNYHLDAQKK